MPLPWVTSTFNAIFEASKKIEADNVARSLASANLGSSTSASKSSNEGGHVNEDSQWFMSTNKPLLGATVHQRKLDLGLLSVGPVSSGAPVSPEWGTVEVIGEHTDEKELTHDKILQFADYARCSIYNQSDRLFLFGLPVHGKKGFVVVFLSTCVVLAQPIDMEAECLTFGTSYQQILFSWSPWTRKRP